jgi:hypothetical protein
LIEAAGRADLLQVFIEPFLKGETPKGMFKFAPGGEDSCET